MKDTDLVQLQSLRRALCVTKPQRWKLYRRNVVFTPQNVHVKMLRFARLNINHMKGLNTREDEIERHLLYKQLRTYLPGYDHRTNRVEHPIDTGLGR